MPSRSTPGSLKTERTQVTTRKDGVTSGTTPTVTHRVWTDSVTFGENLQGWRQRLLRGLSATTSMTGSRLDVQYTSGQIRGEKDPKTLISTNVQKVVMTGDGQINTTIPSNDPSAIDDAKANAEALGKFVKRAYEVTHAIQGGVVLGELGQTLRMIKNPARGLRRQVDEFWQIARRIRKERRLSNVLKDLHEAKIVENLADAWLEWQFGVKPLMNDIRDGSEALSRYNIGQGLETRRITASGKSSGSLSSPTLLQVGTSFLLWVTSTTLQNHSQVIYRGAIRVEPRNPMVMDPALIGFDLSSWAPTLWELIPYSFLFDYFSNIEEIVLGWSNIGIRLAWSNKTRRKYIEKISTTIDDPSGPLLWKYSHEPAKFICKKWSVSRAEYNGTYVPDLTFELPGFGSLKWLNIAALIALRNADRKWSFD